jgi:hypothetical protein
MWSQSKLSLSPQPRSWHSSDWEKYTLAENTKHLVDYGSVDTELDKAVVTRDKGEPSFV